jgi:7,8-dihydropterin-6-yl-methyl-4-(beta-D-ribofuranosyl)aminobenzene 5'-phosphate synthase
MPATPRRRFVLASAALLAAPFGFHGLVTAQQPALAVPAVDSLVLKVITDSSYDTPRPGTNRHVKVKRSPFISRQDWKRALHNEWGLAIALESRIGGDARRMLLDAGYTPQALMNNMEIIGVDGAAMQAIIVSPRCTRAGRKTSAFARPRAARRATSATGACSTGAISSACA